MEKQKFECGMDVQVYGHGLRVDGNGDPIPSAKFFRGEPCPVVEMRHGDTYVIDSRGDKYSVHAKQCVPLVGSVWVRGFEEPPQKTYKPDAINHPSHYNSGKIEVVEAIEDWKLNFHRGNAIKYVARAGKKDPSKEIEDLKKAVWYLNREIELIQSRVQGRDAVKPDHMGLGDKNGEAHKKENQ